MAYNANIHNRQSIRLRGYDYAQAGWYFVTIGVQGHACLFGDVVDGVMQLNDAGWMVDHWLSKVPDKYPSVQIDTAVVMPNHLHAIIVFDLPAAPDAQPQPTPRLGQVIGWFKTMTTNAYIRGVRDGTWPPFDRRLWHRNYYERIIRNQAALDRIRTYIIGNPSRWKRDQVLPDDPSHQHGDAYV